MNKINYHSIQHCIDQRFEDLSSYTNTSLNEIFEYYDKQLNFSETILLDYYRHKSKIMVNAYVNTIKKYYKPI